MSQQPTGFKDLLNSMMKRRWFITAMVLGSFILIIAGVFLSITSQTAVGQEWKELLLLMKKIISEGGIRNIRELSDRYKKAKIYFHQDLDGVATALAMKKYLEDNGIKVVDVEVIQYGDKEFAVKKADATGEIMPVLVDFAHGKPMFVVHTDHHDRQAGAEETKSTQFRGARSNVETLSQIVPASEIFTPEDVATISMVDSADYASKNITPEMVMNYVYGTSKEKSAKENRMLLGLVTNKLLLAFKSKPGFLETLVLDCKPSILSIFNKIKELMKTNRYADISSLEKNKEDYVQTMKGHKNVEVKDNIIVQYGGGSMIKPGSYDRYTPFRNNPEADFLVIAWPLGLLQASCNPFKKERELKGVNLGEIAQEVLGHWEGQLKEKQIPLSTIKWVSETAAKEESVGFTFKDFAAIYGDKYLDKKDGVKELMDIKSLMEKKSSELTEEEWSVLDSVSVPVWEVIQANSGGHKCITNISGLNYIGRSKRPPQGLYKRHYEQYIANLYNQKTRVLKAKAKLPYKLLGQAIANNPNELVNLKLNDRIIIRDNRYIINSFTTDLTSGETSFELINDYRTLGYDSVGYRFANIEMLNIDNTAQEVQIDLFLGVFKQFQIKSLSGWLSSSTVGIKYEDTSMIVTIAANATAAERTDVVGIVFKDYDNNNFEVEIPITQNA